MVSRRPRRTDRRRALRVLLAGVLPLGGLAAAAVASGPAAGAATAPVKAVAPAPAGTSTVYVSNKTSPGTVTSYPTFASGNVSPTATVASVPPSISEPGHAVFHTGNLWVPNASSSTVVAFGSASLAETGNQSPTPAIVLAATGTATTLDEPSAVAFDSSGNLWVANRLTSTVVELTAGSVASSGTPTPLLTLKAVTKSLTQPSDLTFDTAGNL